MIKNMGIVFIFFAIRHISAVNMNIWSAYWKGVNDMYVSVDIRFKRRGSYEQDQ